MSKEIITDELLSKSIRQVEIKILDELPKEEDLSHEFSKKFEKKMKQLIRQEKRTPFMKSFLTYGKGVAATFFIIISISFVTTMSVEAYRVKFFEAITEVLEEFTSITFSGEKGIIDRKLIAVNSEYVPEGFSILEEDTDDYINRIIYVNKNDEEIIYKQMLISAGETLLDTEGIEAETMKIKNQTINFFTNKGVSQVYWNDDLYMYTLFSTIDIEEIIKMTKSILN